MSIIYDALKKVERSTDLTPRGIIRVDKSKSNFKIYLVYALVVVLGFFTTNLFWNFLLRPEPDKTNLTLVKPKETQKNESPAIYNYAPPLSAVVESQSQKAGWSWTLSCIFFSQDEAYALINNKVARVGDVIDGAKVVRIDTDEVELEVEGSAIKLSPK